jgi:hypothetical protein
MKTTLLPFLLLLSFFSNAQSSFEGEIVYQNYDEEMKPIDKTIYKIKGDKVAQYIHNDKKNYVYYIKDSITFYKIGDEFKKSKSNNIQKSKTDIYISNGYDSISKMIFHLKYIKNETPNFVGMTYPMKMTRFIALDSTIKINLIDNFELPLYNQFGYLIKARKNITNSEYFNKTTYSIFQSMTAKPIEDNEFEPE